MTGRGGRCIFATVKCFSSSKLILRTIACLLTAGAGLFAEEAGHPKKPLLWKIEGKGLEKPSYLFGTIHLGAKEVTTLHPDAKKAFDAADAVYTEVPMDAGSQLAAAPMMMRKDGQTLNESVGEEITKRLDEELKLINPALDSKAFQPLATWTVAISLPLLPDQLAGNKGLDGELWEKAAAAEKKTGGIETMASQLGIFAGMPEKDQVIMLSETLRLLKEDREEGRNSIDSMKAAYVSGELKAIEEEVQRSIKEMAEGEHKEMARKFMKRILTDRDVTMAATIAEILKKDPGSIHFFAAGAAHFSSETSIRSHLEKAGFKVTRVGE